MVTEGREETLCYQVCIFLLQGEYLGWVIAHTMPLSRHIHVHTTISNNSCHCTNFSCVSLDPMLSPSMSRWSLFDYGASLNFKASPVRISDHDIGADQTNLSVTIIMVNFRDSWSRMYFFSRRNSERPSCCCCCCCVLFCRLGPCRIVWFGVARFFQITRNRQMCSQMSSPMQSKHWIINVQTSVFCGWVCSV